MQLRWYPRDKALRTTLWEYVSLWNFRDEWTYFWQMLFSSLSKPIVLISLCMVPKQPSLFCHSWIGCKAVPRDPLPVTCCSRVQTWTLWGVVGKEPNDRGHGWFQQAEWTRCWLAKQMSRDIQEVISTAPATGSMSHHTWRWMCQL